MSHEVRFSQLSGGRQQLVRVLQQLSFGRVEQLVIRNSDPVFDPSPRVFQDVKFGSEQVLTAPTSSEDFALKAQLLELFDHLDRIGDGVIDCLVVKHGLPFSMNVAAMAA